MAKTKAFGQRTAQAKAKQKLGEPKKEVNWINLAISVAIGVVLWFVPTPAGLETQAWHMFAIFAATIVALIIKPMPMGSIAICAIALCVLTNTTSLKDGLSGFSNTTIWLIVIAFFISRGFIKTGLGSRVAYLFVNKFGKKTLGLSYALAATDLVLSPAMPSNTARAGGIVFPIVQSLSRAFGSRPDDGTAHRMGSFLHLTAYQVDMVTSAMFMTSMAANPLAVQLAAEAAGIEITWVGWCLAAIVPGILSLILVPLVIYKLDPPEVKETPGAAAMAREKLAEMGPMTMAEKKMIGVFILVLVLWIAGSSIDLNATTTGFIGLGVLLLSGVLTWDDVKSEKGAWDTLVWFSALVMMAGQLNTLGMIPWFGDLMGGVVGGMNWVLAAVLLALVYFFAHYLFASQTAHVTAMYAAFLTVMVAAGAPPMLAALVLGFFSNLNGAITHYACGPAPIFFGPGYVSQGKWWSTGLIVSLVNIVVWMGIGCMWWKVLGLW
ncbi:anion permease [Eggerthella sp. YY7918]|uniref:anion permease n=1 Tax=Eggerthella sp. (strain YY7918) TaxID=502558 RepID=UPI0002171355|nr:anion permease [Eggerthella sp. YY7918]BAK44253.1 dicarboxylate transporter [Eggerthella sp. YY7918]